MLNFVFTTFADAVEAVPPDARNGRIRPGTGAAQNYVKMTQNPDHPYYLKATADGRKEGDFFSSSLSPAPGVKAKGILSIFNSYGKLPYNRLCNGGPITLELAPTYFRNPDALNKGINIIKAFVKSRCQQLQMNLLDREKLIDAQKKPENYRDLVVRVWGWSGYFIELDKEFQDQIINREAYNS
jgi:formate C-acetyltransferase